jgi:undecaprenyl diphosphate synthase
MTKVKKNKPLSNYPNHIVLLPDGNRRWARERGRDFRYGYLKGYENLVNLTRWISKRKIPVLTVFGFSTENWRRPKEQVDYLMKLFEKSLKKNQNVFHQNGIRVRIIGNKKELRKRLQEVIKNIEKLTKFSYPFR